MGLENFRNEFNIACKTLNWPSGPLPLAAGFLSWKLDKVQSLHVTILKLALKNEVQVVWLSFGEDLGQWIEFVWSHNKKHSKAPKTVIFVQVNLVDEVLLTVQKWKVDIVVAQGTVHNPMTRCTTYSFICPPPPRHQIGRPWLGFVTPCFESCWSDSDRSSTFWSAPHPHCWWTTKWHTPCHLPESQCGGCSGGHTLPVAI